MKHLLALLLLLTCIGMHAQDVTIPDTVLLRSLIDDGIDENNDGIIQQAEALNVDRLAIYSEDVTDLTGLEAFTNLTLLIIELTKIESIDLTPFTVLDSLMLHYNGLVSIDVSTSSALTYLNIADETLEVISLPENSSISILELRDLASIQQIENLNNQLDLVYVDWGTFNRDFELSLPTLPSVTSFIVGDLNMPVLDLAMLPAIQTMHVWDNYRLSIITSDPTVQAPLRRISLENCRVKDFQLEHISALEEISMFYCYYEDMPNFAEAPALLDLELRGCPIYEGARLFPDYLHLLRIDDSEVSCLDLTNVVSLRSLEIFDCEIRSIGLSSDSLAWFIPPSSEIGLICCPESTLDVVEEGLDEHNVSAVLIESCDNIKLCNESLISIRPRITDFGNDCNELSRLIPSFRFQVDGPSGASSYFGSQNGLTRLQARQGEYVIKPLPLADNTWTITPDSIAISVDAGVFDYDAIFCIERDPFPLDASAVLVPLNSARPGFVARYELIIKNTGNMPSEGAVELQLPSHLMTSIETIPQAFETPEGNLRWNYANLDDDEVIKYFIKCGLKTPMSNPPVDASTVLHYTAQIIPIEFEENTSNNTFQLFQQVVNSFDPNDKQCFYGPTMASTDIGKEAYYQIRFENTGTAEAITVRIEDEIDTAVFDLSTIVPVRASHDFYTQMTGNRVSFVFDSILLPFEDEFNDGFVLFKVNTKNDLNVGDSLINSADIYFDYNDPIITDEAITIIEKASNVRQVHQSTVLSTISPNPVHDFLDIEAVSLIDDVRVLDEKGRIVAHYSNVNTQRYTLSLDDLSAGLYVVEIVCSDKVDRHKVLKQ